MRRLRVSGLSLARIRLRFLIVLCVVGYADTAHLRYALTVRVADFTVDPKAPLADSQRAVVAVLRALVYLHHRGQAVKHRMAVVVARPCKHTADLSRLVIREDLPLVHDHDFIGHCERFLKAVFGKYHRSPEVAVYFLHCAEELRRRDRVEL